MLEMLGLGFLTNILSTFFSEAIKDRLKPRSSSEKARKGAFYLYELLDEVSASSDAFVSALRYYVTTVRTFSAQPRDALSNLATNEYRHRDAPWEAPRRTLEAAADSLYGSLGELPAALMAVHPQLEIFDYELAENIQIFRRRRGRTINELEATVMKLPTTPTTPTTPIDLEPLQQLLSTAENNQQIIEKTTQDMRDFLAKEFTFKESF
jgi:hypothetical protein